MTLPSLLAGMLIVLAACGSTPPSDYYVLSAAATETPTGDSPSLGVGPVSIPEYLNRNSMVFNRDGNKLEIASFARWAEPLESGISRVLSINLASRLNTEDIQVFPWHPSQAPDYAVGVRLLVLDSNSVRAQLVAEWSLRTKKDGSAEVRRIVSLEETTTGVELSPENVARSYSNLLAKLSDKIAKTIADDMAMAGTEEN
jgi:uncharacterized lipoprotein YmbA